MWCQKNDENFDEMLLKLIQNKTHSKWQIRRVCAQTLILCFIAFIGANSTQTLFLALNLNSFSIDFLLFWFKWPKFLKEFIVNSIIQLSDKSQVFLSVLCTFNFGRIFVLLNLLHLVVKQLNNNFIENLYIKTFESITIWANLGIIC